MNLYIRGTLDSSQHRVATDCIEITRLNGQGNEISGGVDLDLRTPDAGTVAGHQEIDGFPVKVRKTTYAGPPTPTCSSRCSPFNSNNMVGQYLHAEDYMIANPNVDATWKRECKPESGWW